MKRRDFTKAIAGIAAGVVAGTKVFAQDSKKKEDPAPDPFMRQTSIVSP